jgi:hypothetical protein
MSTWQAVVVDGREGALRAFIAGFATDHGATPGSVVVGGDVGLDGGSVGEWLLELVGKGHHVVLAPARVADELVDAIGRAGDAVGLRVERTHPVAGASFAMRLETFSREVAGTVRAGLEALPPGVRVEDRHEEEQVSAEGRGVELYAPVHDYRFALSGRVTGPVGGVVEVRTRLAAVEAMSLEPLRLIETDRPA